jgi:16S rRNA (guanine966-N2)-methyltransferase
MRIVGGSLRGRRLKAPPGAAVRPTSDRAREALFNLLAHGAALRGVRLEGAVVLDAFAGTGALGLEALSRGARRAIFLEADRAALAALAANLRAVDQEDRALVLTRDATRPGLAPETASIAFLDPPYGSGLAAPALAALAEGGWLADGAVVVVEHGAREELDAPAGFERLVARRYGAAVLSFLRWRRSAA